MQVKKYWRLLSTDEKVVEDLHQELKINKHLCKLLVQRGITNFQQAEAFFRPKSEHLHDPFSMLNMQKALRRLEQAIIKREKILLYGDYDVDGTTAIALMLNFLGKYTESIDYYIPDRYKEGYGVSAQGIAYAISEGYTLLITLDCGIAAVQYIEQANAANIDVIICDHHLPGEELPNALAILNPKQVNCTYPFKELTACGVAFKFLQAFCVNNNIPQKELLLFTDLVALSSICDVVPLQGENRVLTSLGLQKFNEKACFGLEALKLLIQKSSDTPIYTAEDIAYLIGPIINAAGRMTHAKEAVRLLISQTKTTANLHAQHLIDKNIQRKEIENKMLYQAEVILQDKRLIEKNILALYHETWHKGIIGIVAGRLMHQYGKPTIILCKSGEEWVASLRSIAGFNVYEALKACKHYLKKFGGHAQAAGCALDKDNLIPFLEAFEAYAKDFFDKNPLKWEEIVHEEISFKQLDTKFWHILKQFEPFGYGNEKPVFMSKMVHDTGYSKIVKDKHLRLSLRQDDSDIMEGIAFDMADIYEKVHSRTPFHVYYLLDENHFQGKQNLQMQVKHIKF